MSISLKVSAAALLARLQCGVILFFSLPVMRNLHGPERFRRKCPNYRYDAHRAPSHVGIVNDLSYNQRRGNHAHMQQVSCSAE